MTDLREAAQMALEALSYPSIGIPYSVSEQATDALRAALAQPEQKHSEQWWRHEVSNAWAEGYEKGRASVKQPEQEPVAWITDGGKGELWWHQSVKFDDDGNLIGENPDDIPLYTAPPQREWQGLTDEEVRDLWSWSMTAEAERTANTQQHAFARAIEAKLKEKNNG